MDSTISKGGCKGTFSITDQCIYCGLCVEVAGRNFMKASEGEYAILRQQPVTLEEYSQCQEALADCPYDAIVYSA